MNKFEYLSIAALLLIISACTPSQQAKLEPSSSQANAADTTNIEAVSKAVNGKNTSSKRQREDDAWFHLFSSKLVDSKGNKYDFKDREIKYDIDLLSKPFSPGEYRSVDFLFDTSKGIKADKFIIEDENFKSLAFKL